ncbi:MAG: hypothetical protein JWN58_1160, partial [Gammaproteobacteria bacterium]|nr:hypothetical protein [Gammaproteobacteria bacterium]
MHKSKLFLGATAAILCVALGAAVRAAPAP